MVEVEAVQAETRIADAARQAFWLLRIGFTVAPILFGVDKFFNWSVHWPDYLADWANRTVPGTAQQFMYGVGVIEIIAGCLVLLLPRFGAPLVALWLAGIIANLLTYDPPEYYDIALRDFGLFLAAVTLTRLAWALRRRAPQPADVLVAAEDREYAGSTS
jgi:uncharacterized membrane protein YphA (DoxX/SURF4 family)